MSRQTEVEIGTEIGPYRVEQLLGRGGMACVYKVWHTGLHRYEALKLLSPNMTYDRVFIERFLMEARTAAGLSFPNIGLLYSVSSPDADVPYFTMELIEGGDLSAMLDSRGRLSLEESLPLLRQIAAGLDYAHGRGVIHRDVKPANVLLVRSGPDPLIKIVDFGIARALESDATRLTKAGMIVGTPEYMSPEQGGSGSAMSDRSDQYSLAVIAYEMLCGQTPFPAKIFDSALAMLICQVREPPPDPLTLTPGLAPSTVAALMRGLAKDPQERYESCTAFVDALQADGKVSRRKPMAAHARAAAQPTHVAAAPRRPAASTGLLAVAGVAVVFVAVICGLMLGKRNAVEDPPRSSAAPLNPSPPAPPSITPQKKAITEVGLAGTALGGIESQIKQFTASNQVHPWTEPQADALKNKLKEEAQGALAHSEKAMSFDPANVDGYITRIRALRFLGRNSAADQAKAKAETLFPSNSALKALD